MSYYCIIQLSLDKQTALLRQTMRSNKATLCSTGPCARYCTHNFHFQKNNYLHLLPSLWILLMSSSSSSSPPSLSVFGHTAPNLCLCVCVCLISRTDILQLILIGTVCSDCVVKICFNYIGCHNDLSSARCQKMGNLQSAQIFKHFLVFH